MALFVSALTACGVASTPEATPTSLVARPSPTAAVTPTLTTRPSPISASTREVEATAHPENHADVIEVSVSGSPRSYRFSVTVRSPDTGCDNYADWWEVLSKDGELIYRRVLLHSHVGEQPFTRSGGPVNVPEDETVIVRGHMNTVKYGGIALLGSVATGFDVAEIPPGFAADVEAQEPLPTSCAF